VHSLLCRASDTLSQRRAHPFQRRRIMAQVEGAEDWPVLNHHLQELGLARMQAKVPSAIFTLLTKGDVMISVADQPGTSGTPYAQINRRTKRLEVLPCGGVERSHEASE
jgi:hypothetical protein